MRQLMNIFSQLSLIPIDVICRVSITMHGIMVCSQMQVNHAAVLIKHAVLQKQHDCSFANLICSLLLEPIVTKSCTVAIKGKCDCQ